MNSTSGRQRAGRRMVIAGALCAALAACGPRGGEVTFTPERAAPIVPAGQPPAAVTKMLDEISAERIRRAVDTLAAFGTRHTLSETASPTRGIGAAREWIRREFEAIAAAAGRAGDETIRVEMESFLVPPDGRRITREAEIVNVVCTIPGSDAAARSRLIYMTAHYDSICSDVNDAACDAPGANDNASGVAALLEAARVMSTRRFPATLVFVATAGEEQGLFGARLHAQKARAAGASIAAVFNNDIIGDPLGDVFERPNSAEAAFALGTVRVFCEGVPAQASVRNTPETLRTVHQLGGENDSPARALGRYIAETAERHALPVRPLVIYRADRFLRGGDHQAFMEQGFGAAVRFTAFREDYNRQHQNVRTATAGDESRTSVVGAAVKVDRRPVVVRYGDLPEFVNAPYVANVTRVNLAGMAHLASAPPTPGNARIITAKLETGTTLRWGAPAGDGVTEPGVAGYEVLIRYTTSPVWQRAIDVGMRTETTLPISKDNVLFGVRAYTREGYRSLAAFPSAGRE